MASHVVSYPMAPGLASTSGGKHQQAISLHAAASPYAHGAGGVWAVNQPIVLGHSGETAQQHSQRQQQQLHAKDQGSQQLQQHMLQQQQQQQIQQQLQQHQYLQQMKQAGSAGKSAGEASANASSVVMGMQPYGMLPTGQPMTWMVNEFGQPMLCPVGMVVYNPAHGAPSYGHSMSMPVVVNQQQQPQASSSGKPADAKAAKVSASAAHSRSSKGSKKVTTSVRQVSIAARSEGKGKTSAKGAPRGKESSIGKLPVQKPRARRQSSKSSTPAVKVSRPGRKPKIAVVNERRVVKSRGVSKRVKAEKAEKESSITGRKRKAREATLDSSTTSTLDAKKIAVDDGIDNPKNKALAQLAFVAMEWIQRYATTKEERPRRQRKPPTYSRRPKRVELTEEEHKLLRPVLIEEWKESDNKNEATRPAAVTEPKTRRTRKVPAAPKAPGDNSKMLASIRKKVAANKFWCIYQGCKRQAKKSNFGTLYCIRHGGGYKCKTLGCTKAIVPPGTHCIAHGGGVKCAVPKCTTACRPTSNFCGGHRSEFVNFEYILHSDDYLADMAALNIKPTGRGNGGLRKLGKVVDKRFAALSRAEKAQKLQDFEDFQKIQEKVKC